MKKEKEIERLHRIQIANQDSIADVLICNDCESLVIDFMMVCSSCNNKKCQKCYINNVIKTQGLNCPVCKSSYPSFPRKILDEELYKVLVKCRYYMKGCKNISSLVDYLKHEEECIFRMANKLDKQANDAQKTETYKEEKATQNETKKIDKNDLIKKSKDDEAIDQIIKIKKLRAEVVNIIKSDPSRWNFGKCKEITKEEILILLELVKICAKIKEIIFTCNSNFNEECGFALLKAIQANSSLVSIILIKINFLSKIVLEILIGFGQKENIKTLVLDRHEIKEKDALEISMRSKLEINNWNSIYYDPIRTICFLEKMLDINYIQKECYFFSRRY